MIKTKEDLEGFYAARADEEVFELFMQKCEEFGLEWWDGRKPRAVAYGECVAFNCSNDNVLSQAAACFYDSTHLKRLTLADFKTKKTRTEWVRVEDSIFDLRPDFECGELYYLGPEGGYKKVISIPFLAACLGGKNLYRKVEKVIDWRIEATNFIANNETEEVECTWSVDGVELSDSDFMKLCHLVAELTEKPE